MDDTLVDDLESFLKTRGSADGSTMKRSTVWETFKVIERMERLGFKVDKFVKSQEQATQLAGAFLAKRHDDVEDQDADLNAPGYNSYVRTIKALGRWRGYNLPFRYMDWDAPGNRALNDEELAALFTYSHHDPEQELLAHALSEYALTIGWDRGETGGLHESHICPPADCEWQPTIVDHKLPLPDGYGEFGSIYCGAPMKGSWHRWVQPPQSMFSSHSAFIQWLIYRPRVKNDPGAIWTTTHPLRGWSARKPRRLSGDSLANILRKMAHQTGLVEYNFRRARHTCGSFKVNERKSNRAIAYDLGHRSWETCYLYTEPRTGYRLRWARDERGVVGHMASLRAQQLDDLHETTGLHASIPSLWRESQRARGDSNPTPGSVSPSPPLPLAATRGRRAG